MKVKSKRKPDWRICELCRHEYVGKKFEEWFRKPSNQSVKKMSIVFEIFGSRGSDLMAYFTGYKGGSDDGICK
jgi:hypothetical protein